MLQSMGSQSVGHERATELNWTELKVIPSKSEGKWFPYIYKPPVKLRKYISSTKIENTDNSIPFLRKKFYSIIIELRQKKEKKNRHVTLEVQCRRKAKEAPSLQCLELGRERMKMESFRTIAAKARLISPSEPLGSQLPRRPRVIMPYKWSFKSSNISLGIN